ncbi:accessory Sec system translocase SecA2 [Liquorilactobacillus sicerae]|uniref:accessory Sec system translocase SecA2 n=1 Tax=Liquorilactobacillus sicerae TaxID=1416943 RepID=UPI00247FCD5C|nr:accessory Sec system translocase SecA2 [Liquorilactobacillus sicerae]
MTKLELHFLWKIVKQVNQYQITMRHLTDNQLKAKTSYFKQQLRNGKTLDEILPEAFAVIREADRRVLKMFPFDVQVLGGIVLHQGNLAEMKTGEGKTLTATMPLYLNALSQQSTWLVTANEYLANRDAKQMSRVYSWLGLSCACSSPEDASQHLTPAEKRQIYQSDIVYTTSSTLGFDYLIDNLAGSQAEKFMRDFSYVIVDEADQVLLDSAQTPLVISGAPRVQSNMYCLADDFVKTLSKADYQIDEEKRNVWLTKRGWQAARQYFQVQNLFDGHFSELIRHLNLALRAHCLFKNGRDYIVSQQQIKLLDKRNGRVLEMSKLEGGLHQALEAAEKLPITPNLRAMASITYQNLFRMFKKLAGMSGTGKTAEAEFIETYYMKVIQIPTNRPVIRQDFPDRIYPTLPEKLYASLAVVEQLHQQKRPILIVTGSVGLSEIYSELLLQAQIPHNVLNARNAAKEALIIAEAGQKAAVTVATSMAGRGTDIKLGPGVAQLGGLAVIGTERMDNRRIELQLRGRAGRQGDPGSSQFFVSLEDQVVDQFGTRRLKKYFQQHQAGDLTQPRNLKARWIKHGIRRAQQVSADQGYQQRKMTLAFDESVRIQRQAVYQQRDQLIFKQQSESVDVFKLIDELIDQFATQSSQLEPEQVLQFVLENLAYHFDRQLISKKLTDQQLKHQLKNLAHQQIVTKTQNLSTAEQENFYRSCVLKAIDNAWIEEVDNLQQLRAVISNRQIAQKNPIYEYHQAAANAYLQMQSLILHKIVQNLLLSSIIKKPDGKLIVYYL